MPVHKADGLLSPRPRQLFRAAMLLCGLVAVVSAMAYGSVFREISAALVFRLSYSGIPFETARALGWVLSLSALAVVLRLAVHLVFGTLSSPQVLALVLAVFVAVFAASIARRDWMFDREVRAGVHLCPPIAAGALPRMQGTPGDVVTGKRCQTFDGEMAQVLMLVRRGMLPARVTIDTVETLDTLATYDARNGAIVLYEGTRSLSGERRFYRGAGFDPYSDQLLVPLAPDRRASLRAELVAEG